MDNLLRICSLDQLADDTEMQDYLTVRISQRQLEQTAFEVKPVLRLTLPIPCDLSFVM